MLDDAIVHGVGRGDVVSVVSETTLGENTVLARCLFLGRERGDVNTSMVGTMPGRLRDLAPLPARVQWEVMNKSFCRTRCHAEEEATR